MNVLEESYLAGVKTALMSEHGRKRGRRAEKAGLQGAGADADDALGPADIMAQHTGVHPAATAGATPPTSLAGHEAAASGKFDAALKNISSVDPARALLYRKQLTRILTLTLKPKRTRDRSAGPKETTSTAAPSSIPMASPVAASAVGAGKGCR